MARARTISSKMLSPRQVARIRELGRPGMGWKPARLARRYGVPEAVIIVIIGKKAAEGRTSADDAARHRAAAKSAKKRQAANVQDIVDIPANPAQAAA